MLLDVREPAAFRARHLPGARNKHLRTIALDGGLEAWIQAGYPVSSEQQRTLPLDSKLSRAEPAVQLAERASFG